MKQKWFNLEMHLPKTSGKSLLKSSFNLNKFVELLAYGFLVIGFFQTITSLRLILQEDEPRMNLEEVYSVKEYDLKLSELAQWLGNNETFWLPDINNGSLRQRYMINFDHSKDQIPSISITSSLIFSIKNVTNTNFFSSIKINLSKKNAYPETVQILNGFN